jgi:hypothetical protein
LGELHLPGSHDAGTTKNFIDKTRLGTDSNSATQNLTITEQLMAGTRFFDLRLAAHNNKVVAHHTTAGQGAYSKLSVDRVLQSAALWCSVHTTEVAIFRISHTALTTNAHEIAKASGAGSLHTGTGNLCTKTLREIVSTGGGLVCIFDEDKFASVINQVEGIHGFTKYSTNPANDHGISCCGCYKGAHDLQQVICNGLKGQYDHNEKHGHRQEHLWQVYWQKTYKNPASSTGIESGTTKRAFYRPKDGKVHGGTHASTGYMLNLMKGLGTVGNEDFEVQKEESHKEGWRRKKVVTQESVMYSTLPVRQYSLPNIFSYDFVNEETNKKIIAMNEKSLQSVQDV